MAQFYTLEEAARVLGMSPEDLKSKAQAREIRAFLDGGSWRFRVHDIDELARSRGLGSDAELRLSDLDLATGSSGEAASKEAEGGAEQLDLSEFQLGTSPADLGAVTGELATAADQTAAPEQPAASPPPAEALAAEAGSDFDLLLDDLSVPPNPSTGSSSVILGMTGPGEGPSDSDVRLASDDALKGTGEVSLTTPSPDLLRPSDSDVSLVGSDSGDLGPPPGPEPQEPAPLLGSSAEVPAAETESSSEFSPSSLGEVLKPPSGSDFELTALESGDEFETARPSALSDSDVTAADPSEVGINLSQPSDSGIQLQPADLDFTDDASVELTPLLGEPAAKEPGKPQGVSLSATPPPAFRQEGEKILDEDSDFEISPAVAGGDDSDDRTVQLEAQSDFELEEMDSASEVFAVDEDEASIDQNAATAMAAAVAFDEEDSDAEGVASSEAEELAAIAEEMKAARGITEPRRGRRSFGESLMTAPAESEFSGLTIALLSITTLILMFTVFVGFDLAAHSGMADESVASGIVRQLAGLFGG